MPKVTVMNEGVAIKEVVLTKERTTLGRRPYNDIVIENLAVSGEHACLTLLDGQVTVEDLNSTNGTYVNGKAIKKQILNHADTIEVGKYKIRFEADASDNFEKSMDGAAGAGVPGAPPASVTELRGVIKVMSGAATGREMPLTKIVSTIGKPGVAVVAITRRPNNFFVHHVEGVDLPLLNGVAFGAEPVALKDGDQIVLAGTQMQFMQS
jgi:hypothetical protein